VRCYGLYASTRGADLAICRAQLGQAPVAQPAGDAVQTDGCQDGAAQAERCPVCGRRLIRSRVILPSCSPPPEAMSGEAVA
jgi:hypothetical protein